MFLLNIVRNSDIFVDPIDFGFLSPEELYTPEFSYHYSLYACLGIILIVTLNHLKKKFVERECRKSAGLHGRRPKENPVKKVRTSFRTQKDLLSR
jgi:hypothetical protein